MRRPKLGQIGWHVFNRGARRLTLFSDDEDYSKFLKLLREAVNLSGCLLWAYALMPNHYHLILHASSEQLTACMWRLDYMFSRYHNQKYGLTGHTFEGPYEAYRQRSLWFLIRKIIYVLLNPVKGRLITRPEEYKWSNFKAYLGVPGSPVETEISSVLRMIDPDFVGGHFKTSQRGSDENQPVTRS